MEKAGRYKRKKDEKEKGVRGEILSRLLDKRRDNKALEKKCHKTGKAGKSSRACVTYAALV